MSFVLLFAGIAQCQDSALIADMYYRKGNISLLTDEPDSALLYYRNARNYAVSLLQLSRIDQNTGAAWFGMYDFERASRYFSHALMELQFSGTNNPRRMLDLYNNLGSAFFERGDLKEAGNAWDASLTLAASVFSDDSMLVAQAVHNAALVLFGQMRWDSAVVMFQLADELNPGRNNLYDPFTAMVRRNLALAFMRAGNIHKARQVLSAYDEDRRDAAFRAEIMRLQGWLEFAEKGPGAADSLFAKALQILRDAKKDYDPALVNIATFRIIRDRASISYLASADPAGTYQFQEQAFAALDACRGPDGSIPAFIFLRDSVVILLERTLETGFKLAESGNLPASELLTLVSRISREEPVSTWMDQAAGNTGKDLLMQRWCEINRRLYRAERREMEAASKGFMPDAQLETLLFGLRNSLDSLKERIVAEGGAVPANSGLRTYDNNRWTNVLQEGQAILDYRCFPGRIYLFIARTDTTVLMPIVTGHAFDSLLSVFRSSLVTSDDLLFGQSCPIVSKYLTEPAGPWLRGIGRLFVISTGLDGIPFESLVIHDIATNKNVYIAEKFAVSHHRSVTDIASLKRDRAECSFVGFAPYTLGQQSGLKNTSVEVETIGGMFAEHGFKARIFEGEEADEMALLAGMQEASVIHISTHSKVDVDCPARSGLRLWKESPALTGDELIDGILELGEVRGLRLGCDLLTLSSCTLGSGGHEAANGETDPVSFFLDAGASHVISSLWNVSDRYTRMLMCDFYRFALSGDDYAEALRKAKVKMLKNEATSSPYLWASFILSTH